MTEINWSEYFADPATYAPYTEVNDIVTCKECYAMIINVPVAMNGHVDYHFINNAKIAGI